LILVEVVALLLECGLKGFPGLEVFAERRLVDRVRVRDGRVRFAVWTRQVLRRSRILKNNFISFKEY
jgi:hypothetical protein